MALDSKQKRGSAIGIGNPSRQWLQEPDGTIAATDRQSLAKLCSAVSSSSGSTGPGILFFIRQSLIGGMSNMG